MPTPPTPPAGRTLRPPSSPFAPGARASGILLHVTSLPSAGPIGTFGPAALAWIDRLAEAGQSWWQMLPLGPTGFGNSPYQPLSSGAIDELLLAAEPLREEGLLDASELRQALASSALDPSRADFAAAESRSRGLLDAVATGFSSRASPSLREAFERFVAEEAGWLDDYALFRALKAAHGGASYLRWPVELVRREPAALAAARTTMAGQIERWRLGQFLLRRQLADLRAHAVARGVGLIGDLPFFVSPDSSDVWANPECFLLDTNRRPKVVAGVPPDDFSADGQLWGNPVYDWTVIAGDGYRFAIERLDRVLELVDLVRLDHFRGYAAAWHVPAGAATARGGRWVPGPGAAFFEALVAATRTAPAPADATGRAAPHATAAVASPLPLVAEDLGLITPDVVELRQRFGIPGTRVLQFGFDGTATNPHLPTNIEHDAVAYTGTHDNPTARGWCAGLAPKERSALEEFLEMPGASPCDLVEGLVGALWASKAALAITPLQDVLVPGGLGDDARMNTPGTSSGSGPAGATPNWSWRCTPEQLARLDSAKLSDLTQETSRGLAR